MRCTELGIELCPILPKSCIFLGEEKEVKNGKSKWTFSLVFYKGIN